MKNKLESSPVLPYTETIINGGIYLQNSPEGIYSIGGDTDAPILLAIGSGCPATPRQPIITKP